MFEAQEPSFTYPSGRKGLRGVSLRGKPGGRAVAMGPNGSGKSTLLILVSTELPSRPSSLAKSVAEGALFSAVAALLPLHWAGTFRTPVPETWQATLEVWNPFRPLHESLLAAAGAGGPDLAPALFAAPIGTTLLVLLLPTVAGRFTIGLGGR